LDKLEKNFIAKYRNTVGKKNVYNITDGGQVGCGNLFHKSNCDCVYCIHPGFKGKNNPMFGVHRFGKDNPFFGQRRIGIYNLQLNKNKNVSKERLDNYLQDGWVIGHLRKTEEHIQNISKALKGRSVWNKGKTNIYSKEALQKMSVAKKNTIYITNGKTSKRVRKEILPNYISNGWVFGRKI
jgi:hypothetical protein